MELPSWIVALQNDNGMNNKQRLRTPEETNKDGENQKKKAANRLSKNHSVTERGGAEFDAFWFFGHYVHNVRLTPELLFFLFLFSALSL